MHLGYLDTMRDAELPARRKLLKTMGASILMAGLAPSAGLAGNTANGFRGAGRMDMNTGEDWIDTFFTGGAEAIIHYYADDFVFEDITLFQTITDKDQLYRAFLPFEDAGPDAPNGVHQFDVIRYDGGLASDRKGLTRPMPDGYTAEEWALWSGDSMMGKDLDYDEWGVMNWVWKAKHNSDFLGLPAKGKITHSRGITFHCYKNRKIVREFTFWNFRHVAIQLGVLEPQARFWVADKPTGQ